MSHALALPRLKAALAGPRYEQVFSLLQEELIRGDWQVGAVLPSETVLARDFGVSVGTMRKALEKLEAHGWITRHPGRGTFVTDWRKQSTQALDRFSIGGQRPATLEVTYLDRSRRPLQRSEAAKLGAGPSEDAVVLRRLEQRIGNLKILDEIVLRAVAFSEIIDVADLPEQLPEYYEQEHGIVVGRCTESLRIQPAAADVARALGIADGSQILVCERVTVDANGTPFELCRRFIVLGEASYEFATEARQ